MKELSDTELFRRLGDFAADMAKAESLQELANAVDGILNDLLPTEYSGLYLYDPPSQRLKLLLARGFTDEEKRLAEETAMDRHPGRIFREKIFIHIPDVEADKNNFTVDSPRSFTVKSRLYMPVMNKDECVGTFGVTSGQKNRFTEHDIELLNFICRLAGVAYSSIILNEEKTKALEMLQLKDRAISYSRDGIIITNPNLPDNPVIYANRAFYNITGYSAEDVIGKNCRFLQGSDSNQEALTVLRDALRLKNPCSVKLRNYRKDGSPFWAELKISPIFNENGELVNYIGIQNEITEEVLAEEKQKESNIRIARILQSIVPGIMVEDEYRRIVLVNENFCKLFDIPASPESLVGFDCSESAEQSKHLFTEPDKFVEDISSILRNRIIVKNEELFLKDGRIFERDYVPIFVNENYKGHLWNYRDITERKRAEEILRESENYSKSLISSLPDLLFVVNKRGIFLDYKAEENELFAKPEMFLNRHYGDVLPPDLASVLENAIANVDATGKPFEIEYSIEINDSNQYFSGKAIPFAKDKLIFFVRNVTLQKEAELRLQNQNRLQSILMKISSQYINMPLESADKAIDESLQSIGKFVEADRCYIFKYDFNKRTTSNTFEWCAEGIEPQIGNLQNIPLEYLTDWVETHSAGKPMLVSDVSALPSESHLRQILESQEIKTLITFPMTSKDECIGFVGYDWVRKRHIISDVENTLLAVFAQLLVNINNRIEIETQLQAEKQNVEISNKALSDFAYIASHDLREPLRKISAFGSLLVKSLSGKLNADERENLDFMIEGSQRMQRMIDDLLFYSRITTKKESYSAIDLDELLNEIIYFDLSEMIEDNKAEVKIENALGHFVGARAQIKQLFQNLIGNGIKYHRKEVNPVIKIRSARSDNRIEFQIEDNGIGIDLKYKDQIFEMFKRLHSKTEYEGSGIGLAVCKKIIELYDGEIELTSEPGYGTIFFCRLPLIEK